MQFRNIRNVRPQAPAWGRTAIEALPPVLTCTSRSKADRSLQLIGSPGGSLGARSTGWTLLIMLFIFQFTMPLAAQDSNDSPSETTNRAADIFRSRIVPLLKSNEKSSCSECHLRGIELSDFLAEDQKQTFVNLRARGWIDTENPENSKLLEFIQRHSEDSTALMKRVRDAELIALTQWIKAAVREPELLEQPLPAENDLTLSTEFIRYARQDKVLTRFCEAIWSQLSRCASCHSPERNQKQVLKHGEEMSWIVPGQPAATLSLLVERKLIDLENPEQSELRTKPLELVKHGGGPKFVIGGQTDQSWLAFVREYSMLVQGKRSAADAVPKALERRSWLSEMQLRITDLPAAWSGRLLALSLHSKNSDGTWNDIPIATGDSPVQRRRLAWQHTFTVFQSISSESDAAVWAMPLSAAEAIPAGRYQLRIQLGRLVVSEDFKPVPESDQLTPLVLVATSEIDAPWSPGYQPPKIMSFTELQSIPAAEGQEEVDLEAGAQKE